MIYLYKKTHNKTGLKYLGKTIKDPYEYKGSGLVWGRHIKKHGYDVTTEILLATEDKREFKETAIFFSKLFDVVSSPEWANLTEEQGQGGHTIYTEERNQKISKKLRNKKKNVSEEGRKRNSESTKNKVACLDTKTGKTLMVEKEVFDSDETLVGVAFGKKHGPMSEEQKQKRRVPNPKKAKKLGDHGMAKSVVVFGEHFETITEALQHFERSRPWLFLRLEDPRWPDCYFV